MNMVFKSNFFFFTVFLCVPHAAVITVPLVLYRASITNTTDKPVLLAITGLQPTTVSCTDVSRSLLHAQPVLTITVHRKKLFINGVCIKNNQYQFYSSHIFYINNQPLSGHAVIEYRKNTLLVSVADNPRRHVRLVQATSVWNSLPAGGVKNSSLISDYSEQAWNANVAKIKKSVRQHASREHWVRVLIDERNKKDTIVWEFDSPDGFVVFQTLGDGTRKKILCGKDKLVCAVRRGIFFCQNKKISISSVMIMPCAKSTLLNGKWYPGEFIFIIEKEKIRVVNSVALEEYVAAVLHSESWPGWPLEVNKAFAIACRSYVLAMVARAKKTKKPYHIKDTNEHQRYNLYGMQHIPHIHEAVDQTRGLLLVHNDEPIVAMFDSCCGGVIPAHIADFDFSKVPYLAREYACRFCKAARLYSWAVAYTHSEFERLLQNSGYALEPIHDIVIHKKDSAGLVQEVVIKNRKKSITMPGKKMYSLSKDIKSYCFTIQKKDKKICISGRGFGHHLGLCQWGARQMVDEGYSYRDILRFYYPGTKFAKISDE